MRYKLSEIFDLRMGKTPSRNNEKFWGKGYKWVSIADIGNANKYIHETKEQITQDAVDESGIKKIPKGTVIMSFKLSIGKTAITSEDMFTNEAIMAFIDKKTCPIDTYYLYHLCCGRDWSKGTNKAVMGLTLNKATLSDAEIDLPDIDEQKERAAKLDFLDSLITARREQLAKLDELVKSRFIELTKHAKTEERLLDHANVLYGFPFDSKLFNVVGNGFPLVRIRDINSGFSGTYTTEVADEQYLVCSGDCLAGMDGNFEITKWQHGIAYLNQRTCKFTPVDIEREFMLFSLKLKLKEIEASTNSTTVKHLSAKDISKIMVPMVSREMQEQFEQFSIQVDKSKLYSEMEVAA